MPSISQSVIGIVEALGDYYALIKKFKEKLNTSDDKDKLKKFFDSFSRNLCWFIGMSAYKLIKVKEVEKDQEKKDKESPSEKMQDLIIQSNLLSGGIENRFITLFSNDTQATLMDLIKISHDTKLQQMLVEKPKDFEDDLLLSSLIHAGKDNKVDKIVEYF